MRANRLTTRWVRTGAVLVAALGLGGCLLNTPTNVTKRFISTVKHLQWDKMEALVDWPSSERALGRPLGGDRHAVLLDVAEGVSSYQISYYGEKRAVSNFLFFKVAKAKKVPVNEDVVRVQIKLKMTSSVSKDLEITTRKVGRTWRVVLTPNLLKKEYIEY